MSTPFIGRLVKLGTAKEATRGVGVAPSIWTPHAELTIYDKANKVTSQDAYGGIWGMGTEEVVTGKYAEGAVSFDAGNETLGLYLLGLLGTVSSAAYLGVYKHTFSLQNDNAHDSLTLTVVDEVEQAQFERTMIESLELKAEVGNLVRATIGVMSNPSTDTSGHTPSFATPVNYLFGHQDVRVYIAATTADLASATRLPLKALTLTISKNLMMNNVLGTVQPKDILNQNFTIEGEIELDYEATTYKDYMLDESYKALRISLINSNITIGTGNPTFLIDLSRVAFSEWETERPLDELVGQKIKFKALYSVANSNVINDCYLVNATTAY